VSSKSNTPVKPPLRVALLCPLLGSLFPPNEFIAV
jgi:hypothetical protein